MERYLTELMRGNVFDTGDSIIRGYHVLDERDFVVEQRITVCLKLVRTHWMSNCTSTYS